MHADGWHADRRERTQLREVFAEKVRLGYMSLNGGEAVDLTPERIVAGWSALLGALDATRLLITHHSGA